MTSRTPITDATAAPIQAPARFHDDDPTLGNNSASPGPRSPLPKHEPPHPVRTPPRKKYPTSFPRATTNTYPLYHPSTLRRSQNHNGESSPTPLDPLGRRIPNHTSRGAHPSLRRHGTCMATANRSASDEGTQTEFVARTHTYIRGLSSTHTHVHIYIRAFPLRTCSAHTLQRNTDGKHGFSHPTGLHQLPRSLPALRQARQRPRGSRRLGGSPPCVRAESYVGGDCGFGAGRGCRLYVFSPIIFPSFPPSSSLHPSSQTPFQTHPLTATSRLRHLLQDPQPPRWLPRALRHRRVHPGVPGFRQGPLGVRGEGPDQVYFDQFGREDE